ncbi:PGF-CTERM sorting domain-containing protein [Natronorubrum aibiense]|uniref:PGF-CTERM sorting domain-containing protein n=2 Tax=Natronorubrum aibiense TaxID=348826 RepID=A0A5P9P7L2_9EURY|nr:PGF-CTERM sorting domain-containing protein [Natronorubrum aibiense]
MIVSMVALSTVAAGAATAAAADDGSADSDLEMTVDAPDSIATTESATFDVTVTTSDGEPATTDVVFEISGEEVEEELTASTDDTGAATFTVKGIALSEGDYEWTVTAGGEIQSGTLTVTDSADDGAADDAGADDSAAAAENDTADADTAENDTTAADNDTAANNSTTDADTAADNSTADEDTAADNDTEATEDDTAAAENDSETEEDEPMPGFGVGGALSALLAGTLLFVRRRS